MIRKALIGCLGLTLMIMLLALPAVSSARDKKVFKWNWQTYAMPTSNMFKTAKIVFERLAVATDGRLVITLHPGNSLVADPQVADAVSKGIIQGCIHSAAYLGGKDIGYTLSCQPPPMLFLEPWQLAGWYYQAGGQDLINKHFKKLNLYHLGANIGSAESIMSKKPINTLADFKGLKIRSLPGPTTMMFEKLGATVIRVPGADLYSAMDTGIVDACELVQPAENWDVKLQEVSKYMQYPGVHMQSGMRDIMVNLKAWKSLPPDLQAALKMAIDEYIAMDYLTSEPRQWQAVVKNKKYGIKVVTMTPEDMAKAKKLGMEVAQEMKKMSPLANEILDSMLNYLKSIGALQ